MLTSLLLAPALWAADPHRACLDRAETTADMLDCNSAELERQDARLNAAYQRRLAAGDDTADALLRQAERAWIAFRDAECRLQADQFRGGTLAGVTGGGCFIDMTRARADALEGLPSEAIAPSARAQACVGAARDDRAVLACVEAERSAQDERLNAAYQRLRAAGDEERQLLLRDAQRAWIALRDAECGSRADEMRGGSGEALLRGGCLADLTHRRADELEASLSAEP